MKKISLIIILILMSVMMVTAVVYSADMDLREVVLEDEENLFIKVGGAEIEFDSSSDKIYLSYRLMVRKEDNAVHISSPVKTSLFNWINREKDKIIIGTARNFSQVNIAAGGISIDGFLTAEEVNLNAGGMYINADLRAKRVAINGAGIELLGRIEAHYLSLNGAGMDVDIEVMGVNNLEMSGAGMDVKLKYLDSWSGKRYLRLDGVGSNLDLLLPGEIKDYPEDELDLDSDGFIDVEIDYY